MRRPSSASKERMKRTIRTRFTAIWMVRRRGTAFDEDGAGESGRLAALKRSAIHWSMAQSSRRKKNPSNHEPMTRRGSTVAEKTLLLSKLIPGMRNEQSRASRIFLDGRRTEEMDSFGTEDIKK